MPRWSPKLELEKARKKQQGQSVAAADALADDSGPLADEKEFQKAKEEGNVPEPAAVAATATAPGAGAANSSGNQPNESKAEAVGGGGKGKDRVDADKPAEMIRLLLVLRAVPQANLDAKASATLPTDEAPAADAEPQPAPQE